VSNVKRVSITGKVPYSCTEHEGMRGFLAAMNAPCFGLRIKYPPFPPTMVGPNEHGGMTAHYNYRIEGDEAVSWKYVDALRAAIVGCGGSIQTDRVVDLEA
jgi:hypothetical protein